MTWEPGMIAVCVNAKESGNLKLGFKYTVKNVGGPLGGGLTFYEVSGYPRGTFLPNGCISTGYFDQSRFRPLDDGDIQGLREKYGEPVKDVGGRVVAEREVGK